MREDSAVGHCTTVAIHLGWLVGRRTRKAGVGFDDVDLLTTPGNSCERGTRMSSEWQ
ncbi:hypothetical protein QFZ22_000725 [Streptomyces canus]|uniref:Uncharacterized protein n=1 Tax=Streptomyces canus TaxID=58343 RepID=A0AAW8F5U7_9ACTN|nr:hypothetical protein [Streptomyces canus]